MDVVLTDEPEVDVEVEVDGVNFDPSFVDEVSEYGGELSRSPTFHPERRILLIEFPSALIQPEYRPYWKAESCQRVQELAVKLSAKLIVGRAEVQSFPC